VVEKAESVWWDLGKWQSGKLYGTLMDDLEERCRVIFGEGKSHFLQASLREH